MKIASLIVGVLAGVILAIPVIADAGHDAKVSAAVGQPKRFGLGQGRYDIFKPDPKRAAASCTPIHDRLGDEWVRAEGTQWQGDTFDLIGGGTRVVGPDAMVSVGGTTYVVWPCLHGVGTS